MSILKFVAPDKEAIKNMPSDLLSELIVLNEVIPDHLKNLMMDNNRLFDRERRKFIHSLKRDDPILREMGKRRVESKKLLADDYIQKTLEYDLEFLEKYPQFKSLFKCINHMDDDANIVGSEPLP